MKIAALLLLIFSAAALPAQDDRGINLRTIKNVPQDLVAQDGIVYKTAGGQDLLLTFFPPREAKSAKAPLVIYIHGGGFGHGNRFVMTLKNQVEVIRHLVANGVAVATIEYRLTDGKGTTAYDAAADCKDALHYFVKNADKYGIDPDRMAVFGGSAGGNLSLVAALGNEGDYPCDPELAKYPAKVRCAAAHFPLVSMVDKAMFVGSNFERPQRFIPLLGGTWEEKHDIAEKLSPLSLLAADSPAIFLAHGDDDKVINVVNSQTLNAAAKEKGVPVECVIVHGAGHGFGGTDISPSLDEIQRRTAEFLEKHLSAEN